MCRQGGAPVMMHSPGMPAQRQCEALTRHSVSAPCNPSCNMATNHWAHCGTQHVRKVVEWGGLKPLAASATNPHQLAENPQTDKDSWGPDWVVALTRLPTHSRLPSHCDCYYGHAFHGGLALASNLPPTSSGVPRWRSLLGLALASLGMALTSSTQERVSSRQRSADARVAPTLRHSEMSRA